jgi:hypothetical protein
VSPKKYEYTVTPIRTGFQIPVMLIYQKLPALTARKYRFREVIMVKVKLYLYTP